MMLYLQELVKQGQQIKTLNINERLPAFIKGPCQLDAVYEIESKKDFYLLNLHVSGELTIQCQRCLDEFTFSYDNKTVIAICRDEERAEQLMDQYECTVAANAQISLDDLLTDELYLYAPQFHLEESECNSEINRFFAGKNESN